jgi:hypothetical protein
MKNFLPPPHVGCYLASAVAAEVTRLAFHSLTLVATAGEVPASAFA